MKKTTTRLATTTAVLLMSAFAIILAQHDARKSGREKGDNEAQVQQLAPTEPPMPLALSSWPSSSAVVRGNNDLEGLADTSGQDNFENPLRDLSPDLLQGAEVITASGEFPAPPTSSAEIPTPQMLQQPPIGPPIQNNLPSLENLPSATLLPAPSTSDLSNSQFPPQLPATTPPAQPSRLPNAGVPASSNGQRAGNTTAPAFQPQPSSNPTAQLSAPGLTPSPTNARNLPGTASLGAPSANSPVPKSADSWANSGGLPNNGLPNMSDTQRGAMIPTQLIEDARNAIPATGSQIRDSYPSLPDTNLGNKNGTEFAPLNPTPSSGNAFTNSASNPPVVAGASPATTPNTGFSNNRTSGMGTAGAGFSNNEFGANVPSYPNSTNSGNEFSPVAGRSTPSSSLNSFSSNDSMNATGPRATLASNQPGSRFLDGSQNPVMQIHKRAPEEITVGKKTTFVITVRNAGNATAHEVTVVDRIPRGVRFSEASPNVSPAEDGLLTWKLGEMNAGEEKVIHLQVIPETEGEIGSVASVHFVAQASVRTMATAPKLEIQVDSTGPVVIGQPLSVPITIRNLGTGVAKGIRLEVDVPPQLKYASGESELELDIGNIRPNDSIRVSLDVASVQPGQSTCPLRIVNEDGVQAQSQFSVDVRAPQLAATISGPAKRYLDRQATYQISISNAGTAVARNMNFDVHLPAGLKFVSADIQQATYHPETHSVTLGLAELAPGGNGSFQVTVLPVELGPQNIRFNATGDLGISAEAKGQMVVEGLSELTFTIGQDNGTVEVGATTTYAVQVSNVGNQSDKNVQLQIQIPEGAKLLRVDAPVDYREEPGRLVFAPIGEMRSRDIKTMRFQIQHNRAGNQVIRAQLTSSNWPVAVLKEEGTLVYNDQ